MAEKKQIYRCARCGQIIEVLHGGAGVLVCCGTPMELQKENTMDAVQEKHLPVLTAAGERTRVQIGAVPHPMTEAHFIGWMELDCPPFLFRYELNPGELPQADFPVPLARVKAARAWCNIHGLWLARHER